MFILNCKGQILLIDTPIVMGIINVTPDSFYSGSRVVSEVDILKQAEKMIADGATILDIGGQSTRPGSSEVGVAEELQRVVTAIEKVHQHFPDTIISVDTYHAEVAKQAVEAGASMVNDIGGGTLDPQMLHVVGSLHVPYICMHIKGTPETMQQHAVYKSVSKEVIEYFVERLEACRLAGIHDLIIDPGFGFAKTIEHNFSLLNNLELLKIFERPVLVGVSRKSTVYKTLGITPGEALNGTTVLHTAALIKGAHILRVHDVKEALEAIKLTLALTATYESQK